VLEDLHEDVAGGTFTGTVRRNFHEKGTRGNIGTVQ
jgi:hypothetical protein